MTECHIFQMFVGSPLSSLVSSFFFFLKTTMKRHVLKQAHVCACIDYMVNTYYTYVKINVHCHVISNVFMIENHYFMGFHFIMHFAFVNHHPSSCMHANARARMHAHNLRFKLPFCKRHRNQWQTAGSKVLVAGVHSLINVILVNFGNNSLGFSSSHSLLLIFSLFLGCHCCWQYNLLTIFMLLLLFFFPIFRFLVVSTQLTNSNH